MKLESSLILLFGCQIIWALEYPKSSKEQKYVENFFSTIPETADADRVKALIENELNLLTTKISSANLDERSNYESLSRLFEQYLNITEIAPNKCSLEIASDYIFLIEFHSSYKGSKQNLIERFLRFHISKQFSICEPIWDNQFKLAINGLDPRIVTYSKWFTDSLMIAKFDGPRVKKSPTRPYSREQFKALVASPPPAGILSYMIRMDVVEINEFAKNPTCTRESFRQSCRKSLLPLCRPICNQLQTVTSVYQFAFNPILYPKEDRVTPSESKKGANNDLMEWLATKSICCKVVKAFDEQSENAKTNLIEAAYKELVDEPESYEIDASEEAMTLELFTKRPAKSDWFD